MRFVTKLLFASLEAVLVRLARKVETAEMPVSGIGGKADDGPPLSLDLTSIFVSHLCVAISDRPDSEKGVPNSQSLES